MSVTTHHMTSWDVKIPFANGELRGTLTVPKNSLGYVLFAHGSGSGRFSPRNREVAGVLNEARFATLLLDLLTETEEEEDTRTGHLRFDVRLLAGRLLTATEWLMKDPRTRASRIGYFGASTGAAAALIAAARRPEPVKAVVSRGGRPDLAEDALAQVRAPTLLIVGGHDLPVLDLNREALESLTVKDKKLEVVPGATHLFEEPGTLEQVAELSVRWFDRYLHSSGSARVTGTSE